MGQVTTVFTSPSEQLLTLLGAHLPTSLTLLRRLQFALHRNFTTPDARIILSCDDAGRLGDDPGAFAVAYAEFSTGPDTQMVMYSSLEHDGTHLSAPVHEQHIMNVVHELVSLRAAYGGRLVYGDSLLLGSLHRDVRDILVRNGRVTPRPSGDYDKWLFRIQEVPEPKDIPEGMYWGRASLDDCRLVASRTDIPRPPESLVKLPGLMLKLDDGTPIAWAFIGLDGSLISLHCEEGYRRRGIAKLLAAKLLRQAGDDFLGDKYAGYEWSSADVAPDNEGSRGMCRSLNASPHWSVSWVTLDLSESV